MKRLLHRLRLWWLARSCSRFWEDMPEDKPGRWVAVAISVSPFREPRDVEAKEVEGLRAAYIVARELAMELDNRLPYANGELGVNWAVRPVKP